MLFDFNKQKASIENDAKSGDAAKLHSFLDMHMRKIESIKDLAGHPPRENECYFLWTLNSFNAFTFIPYLIKEHGHIDELTVSTYSINTRIADSFMRHLSQGSIAKVKILLAESMSYRMPKVVDHLKMSLADHPSASITYGWNHSKITLVRSGDHHYVIEGSGNWSENAAHEQYIFINSPEIYAFRRSHIDAVRPRKSSKG